MFKSFLFFSTVKQVSEHYEVPFENQVFLKFISGEAREALWVVEIPQESWEILCVHCHRGDSQYSVKEDCPLFPLLF